MERYKERTFPVVVLSLKMSWILVEQFKVQKRSPFLRTTIWYSRTVETTWKVVRQPYHDKDVGDYKDINTDIVLSTFFLG